MMKKLTKLLILCFLAAFVSCSDEETLNNDVDVAAQELAFDLSEYADTSYGLYKGVFTTEDSQSRGVLEIQVISESFAKAKLDIVNESQVLIEAVPSRTEENTLVMQFEANGTSFIFEVDHNGSNPTIKNAILNDISSLMTTIKENTRGAVLPASGAWSTDDNAFNGTWNFMFTSTGEGDDMGVMTQILIGSTDVGSMTGNSQSNCVDDGVMFTTCDLVGASAIADNEFAEVSWTGTHIYGTGMVLDCSDLSGDFSATGAGGASFSGTWVVDSLTTCNIPEADLCSNATVLVCGDALTNVTDFASMTGQPDDFCGTSSSNAGGVWYTYTGTADANSIVIDTNGSDFDTKLFLYTGECGALVCLDGDDDGGEGSRSLITFEEVDGEVYYILAAGFNASTGSLNVNINCLQPAAGDTFETAIPFTPLAAGTGCSSDTIFEIDFGDATLGLFTDSSTNSSCFGAQDVFYTWTATEENLVFSPGSGNPGVAIYNAGDGTEIDCIGTFSSGVLSGWAIGDDLVIQIFDGSTTNTLIGFCLEEMATPPPLGCGGQLVDSGGTAGDYAANDLIVDTITAGVGETISLNFSVFDTESNFDFMRIFDGADTSAPEITMSVGGTAASANGFDGNSLMGDSVVSTGNTITIEFDSDASVQSDGYVADIVCVPGFTDTGDQTTDATNTRAANRLTDQELRNRKPLILNEDEKRELAQKNKQ